MLSYEHKLKQREDTINDLERDASYFIGKKCFDGRDCIQNYFVFQPMYTNFKTSVKGSITYVFSWGSKRLSNEKISSVTPSNYNQAPILAYDNVRIKSKFIGALLKQAKITYNHGPIVNLSIVYRLSPSITSDVRKLSSWRC